MTVNIKTRKKTVTDAEIMDLYWERNETAIQLTKEKYGAFLYRIAYNILHDDRDCEECQNDTYLGVWQSIPPSRPDVFPAFIARIMRNVACKKYKEKTRKKRVPSEMTVSLEDLETFLHNHDVPDEKYFAEELGKMINSYLPTLTDRQQYVFIGRFYMGDKLETIAGELKVNASTVHREIEKIKKGLKSHLERNGYYV